MELRKLNSTWSLLAGLILVPASFGVHAQAIEFADDFSTNTIRYSVNVQNDNGVVSSVEPELGAIRMTTSVSGTQGGGARLSVNESTDTFQISGRFDADSINLTGGWTQIGVDGLVSNDIPVADRSDANSDLGNIYISINSAVFTGGSTNLYICLGRNGVDGFESLNLFDGNTNNCKNYDDVAPAIGENFNLGYTIGTDNVVTLTLGATTDTLTLPGTYHAPAFSDQSINHTTSEVPGSGSFLLTSITTDNGTESFASTTPVIDRYEFNVPGQAGFPTIVDGRVRADFTAREDGGNSVELILKDVGTYFEATTELSSESTIDGVDQGVGSYMEVVMGNDTQDNGFDGRTGDIRANIAIDARNNGLRRVEYCLYRYDDADGENRTGLLNGGEDRCVDFAMLAEFDTSYRMAIDFDHTSSTITFRVNGNTYTETLAALFAANSPRSSISIGGNNGARFVGFIDDIRNSKSALTTVEAAGSGTPAAFPPAPTSESITYNSSVDVPYDFRRTPLTFIDDFSADTSVLGLEQWSDTDSSITYTDGAVELQAHSNRDPNDGGGATSFDIRSVSDTIVVVGALSSDSSTGPGNRNEVSLDVEAILFNDTNDGGDSENTGDIETKIRLIMEGNGRRRIQAEYRRRAADGNNDRMDVFPDGEDRYNFDGLIPELDRFYTITLQLDRANQQFIYSVDDKSISVPIPGGVFEAASNRVQVRAYQQGTSGRAEIRLHSIEVDDQLFDFQESTPVLAPYRPRYSDEVAGVDTSVVNGRLRMEADGRINAGRDPQMRVRGRSTFVGADIELSSESVVAGDESVFVGVSGLLYSEVDNSDDDSTGSVFATVRLRLDGDGSRYVERCAFRSNDENFDDSDELIGGDPENCTRFNTVPELDTAYPASIAVNEDAKTLTFKFADESLVYDITSDIITMLQGFNGVRARANDNSKVIAFADNLAFSENPVPLAQSDQNFGNVVGESLAGESETGGSTTETGGSSGGGSGGGCSVGGGGNPVLILLALLALLRVYRIRATRQ